MDDDSTIQRHTPYVSKWRPLHRCFPTPNDDEFDIEGLTAWDLWRKWAIEDGVPDELAFLGSQVIRQAHEDDWTEELQRECGWEDDGENMMWCALNIPEKCRIRWQYLIDSDGDFCWDDPRPNPTGYVDLP